MADPSSFDSDRNQWFTELSEYFTSITVPLYQVGSNQQWGPDVPGCKYTDYYYNNETNYFTAYVWDPDGTVHCDVVEAGSLRSDGQSFLYLEWQSLSRDSAAYWGELFFVDRERNGRWRRFFIHQEQWPTNDAENAENAQYGGGDDCCCVVM